MTSENIKVLLALDMSTTCTGFAVFNPTNKDLLDYGIIKPKVKGISKLAYPEKQLLVTQSVAAQILDLYIELSQNYKEVTNIVIEEVNAHKNRLSGKTLDGLHFIVWDALQEFINKIVYMDSDGFGGWRRVLNLRMSDADREHNKEAKKLNKKVARGQKIPIINKKHLACRYANRYIGMDLDCDKNKTDGDIADAVCLGYAYLKTLGK